jgi:hypothetical protein
MDFKDCIQILKIAFEVRKEDTLKEVIDNYKKLYNIIQSS